MNTSPRYLASWPWHVERNIIAGKSLENLGCFSGVSVTFLETLDKGIHALKEAV
jgi:hypothetical protein